MVYEITRQADEYVRAIDLSLDMAQKGSEFADDAIELCNIVAKGDGNLEHLERFLSNMLEKANTAHTQAFSMNEQFARVRRSLFQVSSFVYGDIPRLISSN
jgi:hypothetical protein